MARILRGEIRWADLNPVRGHEQAGRRPVLVLSHDVFNARSGTVIAVVLTSQEPRAGFPLTLESKAAGLPKRSWIKIQSDPHVVRRPDWRAVGAGVRRGARPGPRRSGRTPRIETPYDDAHERIAFLAMVTFLELNGFEFGRHRRRRNWRAMARQAGGWCGPRVRILEGSTIHN